MKMKIKKTIIFLRVDEYEKCIVFAEKILDLELWKEKANCRIYMFDDTCGIGYCKAGGEDTSSNGCMISLVTDDVDGCYEILKEASLAMTSPKKNEKYDIYHFFASDPAGNTFEFMKFL